MKLPTVTVSEGASRASNAAPTEGPRAADTRRVSRPHETVQAVVGAISSGAESRRDTHVTYSKAPEGRALTDGQRKMLENLDKHGDVKGVADTAVTVREGSSAAEAKAEPGRAQGGEPAPEPKASSADAPATPAPAADSKPAEAKAEPAKTEVRADDADLKARYERALEHNKRLVEELEARDKAGPGELDDRYKELDAIERDWSSDPIASMRRMVALNAGLKSDDPMVDRLMGHIYKEWTGKEFKVEMDDGTRAAIGTDRNRLLIERDKRERAAAQKREEDRAKKSEAERRAQAAVKYLEDQLGSKYADRYQLLKEHAPLFDNLSPAHALFTAISRGIAAGQHKETDPDDILIDHYARELEERYKPRYSRLEEIFTKKLEPTFEKKFKTTATATSTTTPGQAPASEARDPAADAPRDGARTLTNASASVAPPAPPADATPAKDDKQPPKWRSEEERRQYFARLRFGD